MPEFSQISKDRLSTCHPLLIELFDEVVKAYDCSVNDDGGHRGKEAQDAAFAEGTSQIQWPNGKHNRKPSEAVDVSPYPIDWNDLYRFGVFAGYVIGVASSRGIIIRWGGDWDRDWNFKDQDFNDLSHFELLPGKRF